MRPSAETRANEIIGVVLDLIASEGYEAVQVRTVAMRARISLTTLYKLFGTLDQLLVEAIEQWMEANAFSTLTMPQPGESPYQTLVAVLRAVFDHGSSTPRCSSPTTAPAVNQMARDSC